VWDLALSHDPEQRWIYMADGSNEKIYVIERETLEVVTEFGDGGRYPGTFLGVHSIAVDSRGNIFTTETYEGKRVQKHAFMGYGSPPADQGVARAAPAAAP
jgi:DNA-binding beta-propeller fold protein YncE